MKKRVLKRILGFLLTVALLLSFVPMHVAASPSIKSDSAFFAQLDLDTAGLQEVKTAVTAGNYTSAKSALLTYYKQKFANYQTSTDGIGSYFGTLAMLDTFAYLETPLANKTISHNNGAFQQYSFGIVNNTSGCYVLSALKKTGYAAEICAKEYATESMRPVLKCYNSAGTLLASVNPAADATVKYGSKATNFGTETTIFARHDATTALPYSTNSQRAYLKFNVPSGTAKTELVIYAKASSSTLDLWQFDAMATTWTESNLSWSWLVSNNVIGHYSYDGVSGGFDWQDEEGTQPHSWIDMHCRLHSVHALLQTANDPNTSASEKEKYLNKGKSLLFDFINDADVSIGWPEGRDKETPFRLNYAPFFYKTLLENDKLTADENITFLKWIFDEIEFLDAGGNLFSNTGTSHASSAYTNHAFFHISGFYSGLSYFSEFKNESTWRDRYYDRWNDLINDIGLLGTDGSYNEGLLGAYSLESLSCVSYIAMAMKDTGDTTSANSKLYTSYMIKLMRFMMDVTFPNNHTPATGQRGASVTKPSIIRFLNSLSSEFYSDQGVQELKYFVGSDDTIAPKTNAYYPIGQFATDRTGYTTSDSMIYISARAGGHYDHPDALAILLYHGGRYLLAETATTDNTTAAHNTIECNATNQATALKQMTYKDNSTLNAVGNKGASSMSAWTNITEGFNHYREVSYLKALNGLVIVTDKAQYGAGTSSTKYNYVQNWHTSAGSNASVAADSYDTGKTAFSSASNLIIAQASGNSISATVSGNNFKYTQKVAGAATYQTVIYPVKAGATATVQPNKITLDVADSVARASLISINDSSNTSLKSLCFYQSFETAPASRAFGSFTTDASNAAIAENASSQRNFASFTNGSAITVTSSGVPVLKTSQPVTDLSATLNGTTIEIESSDADIAGLSISVNFAGAAVSKVMLNGEEVPFYTDADSTIIVGQQIIHFYGEAMGELSNWTVNQATLSADSANSVVNGTATGGDPYLFNVSALNHYIKSGDIVEIRLKTTVDSTTAPTSQIFFRSSDGGSFGSNAAITGTRTSAYVDGEFSTLRFTFLAKHVGKTITSLRIDPFSNLSGKTFSIDYIYVGAPDKAPSTYKNCLFFDFTNDAQAEHRYTSEVYGDRNYDLAQYSTAALSAAGTWYMNGNQTSHLAVSGEAASITHKPSTGNWGYLSTANCLKYYTNPGDIVQVRLKTLNMEVVPGQSTKLSFYANNSTADLSNTAPATFNVPAAYEDEVYYTLQADLSAAMINADYLTSARLQWFNLRNIEGKTGKIVIDYIYIGPAATAPGSKSSYQINYHDGVNLLTAFDADAATSIVNGGDNTSTYNVCNRTITIQNKRTSGETYHYFNKDGAKFELTAGTQYHFSCTTSGTWGSQVEAFLRIGNTHIRMNSNDFTFTPTITGTYYLRFDVNVAGQTHTFSNISIVESPTIPTSGSTAGTTHFFGEVKALAENAYTRPGYTFKGWSTSKNASAATYTNSQSVKNITNIPGEVVTLYAVWEANTNTVTFKNHDGTVLATQTVKTGLSASYTGQTPTKSFDANNHYTFSGWDKSLSVISSDLTVTAQFAATAHSYSYTNKDTANHTAKCSCGFSKQESHTVVTDKAVVATCTTAGKTEGSHCSVCNAVIKAQTVIPATGHSYDSGKITTQPTCTAAGIKTYTCSACNATKTEAVSAKGHTEVVDKAVAATCTTAGKTEGSHCSVCNAVIKAQTAIPATGHTEVVDKAVAATCTTAGKTQGKHCSVCNAVLVAQNEVAALGHSYKSVVTAPTCKSEGFTTYTCSVCNDSYIANKTEPLKHTQRLIDNGDGTHYSECSVCHEKLSENIAHSGGICECGFVGSYRIIYNDGVNLLTAFDENVGSATVSDGNGTYSVTNRTVTVTNKRAAGEVYHYFDQELHLTAGKTYSFSCATSGTYGSQVEVFVRLVTGDTYGTAIRMDGTSATFTPAQTGIYRFRLDVNAAGETHTFSDISIVEGATTVHATGSTATSAHTFGTAKKLTPNAYVRDGYTFKGWSREKGAMLATYADSQSVLDLAAAADETVTLYAVWEANTDAVVAQLYQLPSKTKNAAGTLYGQNMSYVIQTKNGSIVVIDGGYENADSDAEYLLSFLQEITGKTVPNVDAWIFTHPHEDHIGAFMFIAANYADKITVSKIYYNFPTDAQIEKYAPEGLRVWTINYIRRFESLIPNIKQANGEPVEAIKVLAKHRNSCLGAFEIDTLHIEILLTCDDLFEAADSDTAKYSGSLETNGKAYSGKTIKELVYDDFGNNVSIVFRITSGGKNAIFLGDAAEPAGLVLRKYHDTKVDYSLDSDIVQMAHHGQTGVPKSVYQAIDPDVCLWPAPDWVYNPGASSTLTTNYTKQWISELGAVSYVSMDGVHTEEFTLKNQSEVPEIPEDMKPLIFDATYYANCYSDVKEAFGTDEAKLYAHFITYGLKQGRSASPYFDVKYYANQNSQKMLLHCRGDYLKAFAHFVKFAYDESEFANAGKKLSPIFDSKYYRNKYSDIKALNTELEALAHFVNVGQAEGRAAAQEVISLDGTVYHTPVNTEATSATCTADGYTAGRACSTCGKTISGRAVTPAFGHNFVNNVCTICGYDRGYVLLHFQNGAPELSYSWEMNQGLIGTPPS